MRLSAAWVWGPPVTALLLGLAMGMGCGDGHPDTTDSSTGADTGTPPPSGRVSLTPCPAGWREVHEEGEPTVCDPWPVGGRQTCDPYSGHFPGEAGCTAIGTPCPTGDFEEGLFADGTVLFVQSSTTGGDGSVASPFGSIAEALASAPAAGSTLALAKGTYDGAFAIPGGVTIRGACVSETHLTFEGGGESDDFVTLTEAGSALENVFIASRDTSAVVVDYMAEARIEDVVIEGSGAGGTGWGINHSGAVLVAKNMVFRNLDLAFGYYLEEPGHHVDAQRIIIEDSAVAIDGTSIDPEASFNLRDASIIRTTSATIQIDNDPGRASITRTVIEQGTWSGVYISSNGPSTLTDVVVRDIEGVGIIASFTNVSRPEPGVILRRVRIDRVREAGIHALWSTIDAQGLVIQNVLQEECGTRCTIPDVAAGIASDSLAKITVDGFYVSDVDGCGVNIGEDGEIDITNGEVRRATIGACIRGDDYDLGRLTDGVRYTDNMSNLDSTGLPVPSIEGVPTR